MEPSNYIQHLEKKRNTKKNIESIKISLQADSYRKDIQRRKYEAKMARLAASKCLTMHPKDMYKDVEFIPNVKEHIG